MSPYELRGVICQADPSEGERDLANEVKGGREYSWFLPSDLSVLMHLLVLSEVLERLLDLEADTWNNILSQVVRGVDLLDSLCDFGVYSAIFFTALALLTSTPTSFAVTRF